ncbi:hypothetical protein PGB90_001897 [Kerria lacca]
METTPIQSFRSYFFKLKDLARRLNISVVVKGLVNQLFDKLRKSNRIIHWSLQTAEDTVVVAIDISKPTIVLLDGPIHLVDEILCKSLDMVEDASMCVCVYIYNEAKNYVTSVMEPVLKRADSVKEISIQSAINYSTFAAESLDNVLTVADEYVDKYLPEIDSYDQTDKPTTSDLAIKLKELFKHELTVLRNYGFSASPIPQTPTEKTIRHVNKFSRTLKRRLTMRTMYEARELKKQGVNLIHVLVHMTDLLARDPKAFYQKMKDLWSYLSEDEPENQEPPQNLEQLLVMITREGARRFVHVTNFSATTIAKIPSYATEYITFALHKYSEYVEQLKRKTRLIKSSLFDFLVIFTIYIIDKINNFCTFRIKIKFVNKNFIKTEKKK